MKQLMDTDNRIVDSLYFGTFAKASAVWPDNKQGYYVYCPGPKAILKLVENEENLADLPQQALDDKLTQVNVAQLAE